ncbi:hypothetical protein [Singulisphaera acidiphila]|nr:hypothetical protein [Singulisphaera acidiphila]
MSTSRQALLPRWLLDTLAVSRLDLTELSWDRQTLEEDLNREVDEFDAGQLAQAILTCIASGILEVIDKDGDRFSMSIDQLEHSIRGEDQRLFVGLTEVGGEYWESLSHPDWSRFVDWGTLEQDGNTLSMFIEAYSRERINEVFGELRITGYNCISADMKFSIESPWHATYWKSFPEGHRLEFLVSEIGRDYSAPTPDWFSRPDFWYS